MELSEYLRVISGRRSEMITIVLVVLLIVLILSILQKPIYQATAVIEYQELSAASNFLGSINFPYVFNQPERQLSTQADLLSSKPLAEEVIKKLRLDSSAEELLRDVSVSFEEKTNLINVTVEDNNPRRAQIIANTLVQTFLENSKKSSSAEVSKARDEVYFKMKDIQEDILLYSQIANEKQGSSGQANENLKSQITIATSIYTDLAGKYQQLKILEDLSTGGLKLAVPASIPKWPSSPNISRNIILALILGFIGSTTWIFSTEYFDNTVKSTADVEKYFNLPMLGQIPLSKFGESSKSNQPATWRPALVKPNSFAAEAYRHLRTNIQFLNFEDQARTIVITSPTAGEGKTTVAANLAATLSLTGSNVILLDCDLRHPKIHQTLGVENFIGFSNLLIKSHRLPEVIQIANNNLPVITSGPKPPNPSELLGSNRMTELIQTLKEDYDYIIIDTPPVCAVTDAAVLAAKVDAVILISAFNTTTREAAADCRRILDKVNSKILGAVMNKIDAKKGRYGYYSYYGHYYHGQYYGQDDEEIEKENRKAS